jgi:hypothetical protein
MLGTSTVPDTVRVPVRNTIFFKNLMYGYVNTSTKHHNNYVLSEFVLHINYFHQKRDK